MILSSSSKIHALIEITLSAICSLSALITRPSPRQLCLHSLIVNDDRDIMGDKINCSMRHFNKHKVARVILVTFNQINTGNTCHVFIRPRDNEKEVHGFSNPTSEKEILWLNFFLKNNITWTCKNMFFLFTHMHYRIHSQHDHCE